MPLRSRSGGQCVVATHGGISLAGQSRLWLEDVYFRMSQSVHNTEKLFSPQADGSQLMLSNVVVQGTGSEAQDCDSCVIADDDTVLVVEGGSQP